MSSKPKATLTTGELGEKQRRVLTKDEIRSMKGRDIEYEYVKVPEWGKVLGVEDAAVRVKGIGAVERDRLDISVWSPDGTRSYENVRARTIALSVVDEEGKALFGLEDVELLGELSAKPMDRIFDVAQRLGGMLPESLDNAVKNLNGGQSGGSSSD